LLDAWNRLVKVSRTISGSEQSVAEYEYDGRNFRTVKRGYAWAMNGALGETRHYYYNGRWQDAGRMLQEVS
jgi:hypothetical protein